MLSLSLLIEGFQDFGERGWGGMGNKKPRRSGVLGGVGWVGPARSWQMLPHQPPSDPTHKLLGDTVFGGDGGLRPGVIPYLNDLFVR